MSIRVLNGEDVRRLLSMEACIPLMRAAFTAVAQGRAVQPLRQAVRKTASEGFLSLMPGYVEAPESLGIKLVTVFANSLSGSTHQGMVVLFDPTHGAPIAIVDTHEITAIRTAAATAAATDALAAPDADTLAVLGTGEQARTHLEALPHVRPFRRIEVWGRDPGRAEQLADWFRTRSTTPIAVAASAEAAVRSSQVICTVSAAADPIIAGEWLQPGQHLNVVGSSIPTTAEVDNMAVRRARVFVDFRLSALALGGELQRAREAGVIGENHIVGEIGAVLAGDLPGRRSANDITLFKSLGMSSEDLLSASFVLREAEAADVGQVVNW